MEKTSFNPSTIAEHVISHLTDRGMVGKLYTKYSVATHFNPHEVTYRYWVSAPDSSAETEIEYFVPQAEQPTKITISHNIKDCLEKPLRENQHQEYAMVGRGTFNSIITVKKEARKKNSLFEMDVQVINHALPKQIYEDTIRDRDITSLTSEEIDGLVGDHNIDEQHQDACAISQLSIRETVSQKLQPDPRIYGRTRYVETRNIVVEQFLDEKDNPINDMDTHAGGCQIQFNDYGLTIERIVKPQVSESRSFMEILKQSPVPEIDLDGFAEVIGPILKFKGIQNLYDFQIDSFEKILVTVSDEYLKGIEPTKTFLLKAATAGGKTEAFLLPICAYLWSERVKKGIKGTKVLLFYPTKALADDQFQRIMTYLVQINRDLPAENKIRIGVYHGDTPRLLQSCPECKNRLVYNSKKSIIECTKCKKQVNPISHGQGKCPWCYNRLCPKCKKQMEIIDEATHRYRCEKHGDFQISDFRLIPRYEAADSTQQRLREKVTCYLYHPYCGRRVDFVDFAREKIYDNLPDIVIMTPDIAHTRITGVPIHPPPLGKWIDRDTENFYRILGKKVYVCSKCGALHPGRGKTDLCIFPDKAPAKETIQSSPAFIVVDEIHMFKGNEGGNMASFFSNLKYAISGFMGKSPVCISSTATVKNERIPPACMFGYNSSEVEVIAPAEHNPLDDKAPHERLHLFVYPKGTSSISGLREVLNAIYCTLPSGEDETTSRPRTLVFFDNRKHLYEASSTIDEQNHLCGAVSRIHTSDVLPQTRRRIEDDFSRGNIQVVYATSTLEVGVDFDDLNILINHGAPYSYNTYLQRVGRAGRRQPALVINILRYHVPLDNYYFEHYEDLVQYSKDNVDIVPIVRDIPKSVRRHVFAHTAITGRISGTEWDYKRFYNTHLALTAYPAFVGKVLAVHKPDLDVMGRDKEVEEEIMNACGRIQMDISKFSDTDEIGKKLNNALNRVAMNDITQKLNFNLRSNEKTVDVQIVESERNFIDGLVGAVMSSDEDVDVEEMDMDEGKAEPDTAYEGGES